MILKSIANFVVHCLVLPVSLSLLAYASAEPPSRPNIVIVMTDDQGWGDTGFNGHPNLQTPELDELAASGLRFNRFYCVGPVCSPTRAAQLTGRHYERQGITNANAGRMLNQEITLAELAQTQGYRTGHFGKWHLGALTRDMADSNRGANGNNHEDYSAPWHNGFDTVFSTEAKVPTFWNDSGPNSYNDFGTRYWTGPGQSADTSSSPPAIRGDDSKVVIDPTIDFIRDAVNNDQPFLAVTWLHTPHAPVMLDPNYQDGYHGFSGAELHYYTAISAMDAQVGRLRDELRLLGIEDDTIFIFTSDNGPEGGNAGNASEQSTIGDPDGPGGDDPIDLRERKRSVYEGGIRVPGIVEWPSHIAASVSDVPVATTDILPTMLDVWNIDLPDSRPLDGESITPILFHGASARSNTIKTLYRDQRAIMDNRYKLVDAGGGWELYDIVNDPEESNDVYDSTAETQAIGNALRLEYEQWIASVDASRNREDYGSHIVAASATATDDAGSSLTVSTPILISTPENLSSERLRERGGIPSDSRIGIVLERQLATLQENVDVDTRGASGTYDDPSNMLGGMITAGTVVDSFLIHGQPITRAMQVEVTIEFENDILGVIADSGKLVASDFLAFRDPIFGDASSGRGSLEPMDDGWMIRPDGRTLVLFFHVTPDDYDQFRVITKSSLLVPEPTASALALSWVVVLLVRMNSQRLHQARTKRRCEMES